MPQSRALRLLALIAVATACSRAEPRDVDRRDPQLELVLQDASPGTHVAFSPDDRLLATTSADATTLWETTTGRLLRVLPATQRDVVEAGTNGPAATRVAFGAGGQQVVFSPDGRYVAALPLTLKRAMDITDWRSAQAPAIWEVSSGRALTSTPWREENGDLRHPSVDVSLSQLLAWSVVRDDSAVQRVVADARTVRGVSADGRHALTIDDPRAPFTLTLRELPSGRVISALPETYEDVQLVALSPDAQWVAVGGHGGVVDLWNLSSRRKVATLAKHTSPNVVPRSLAFSADSKLLAIGGNRLQILRVADQAILGEQMFEPALGEGISELAFSEDGRMIAGTGSSLRLFAVPSAQLLREFLPPTLAPVSNWAASSTAIAIARDRGQEEWSDAADYHATALELWPLDSGAPRMLDTALQSVASLAFSANGRWLAAAMQQSTVIGRYTSAFAGDIGLWALGDGRRLLPNDRAAARPASQVSFGADDSTVFGVRLARIQNRQDCDFDCNEDEHTEYRAWLDAIDVASRSSRRIAVLGRSSTAAGSNFLLSPTANRVAIYGRRDAQLLSIGAASAAPTSISGAVKASWPCAQGDCVARWSPDGTQLAVAGAHVVLVVDGASGALLLEHDLQTDTSDVTIRGMRFMPGDSTGLAIVAAREGSAGSTLYRLDIVGGSVRAMMRFPEVVEDVLFIGNRVLTRSRAVVRVYDLGGRVLVWLLRSTSGRWAVVTPDGLYDEGGGGAELVAWRVGSRLVAPSELPAQFRVPGLLSRIMRGDAPSAPPRGVRVAEE